MCSAVHEREAVVVTSDLSRLWYPGPPTEARPAPRRIRCARCDMRCDECRQEIRKAVREAGLTTA
jgi:hypothetical protein